MVVRFFEPLRTSARIRFSGMPHKQKNSIRGNPAQAESANHDDRTVKHVADRFIGIGDNFVHRGSDSKSNSATETRRNGETTIDILRYGDEFLRTQSSVSRGDFSNAPLRDFRVSVVGSRFLSPSFPQQMRLLEFFRQLPRRKILTDVSQLLFQLE